ncbi:MAG: hypothetical protein P1P83_11400 [Bacteroidales bacterium]|nr:hypothetical protein [Bacteroidales bacterium]
MKKLIYFFAAIMMVAALGSCEQDESEISLKKGDAIASSTPDPSDIMEVTPVIIPGANNGGNRTCAEVAAAFSLPADYFLCGEKVDYYGGVFAGNFPDGVLVNVTHGKFIDFELEGPIMIGDKYYVVGAVIVKGGNAANVYFYPGGTLGDSGLTAPVNASGKAAGLSNLTFCLVEKVPELVIALKTYLATPIPGDTWTYIRKSAWAVSGGLGVDPTPGTLHMGYNYYIYGMENTFDLVEASLPAIIGPIGTIKARDYYESDIHYLEVVLDINRDRGLVFDNSYLYVGSYEGYEGRYYTAFQYTAIDNIVSQRVFKIDLSGIKY